METIVHLSKVPAYVTCTYTDVCKTSDAFVQQFQLEISEINDCKYPDENFSLPDNKLLIYSWSWHENMSACMKVS